MLSICTRAYCHHLLEGCYYLSSAVSCCWCGKVQVSNVQKSYSVLSNLTWKGNSPPQLHNWFLTDLVLTLLHFPCLCFLPAGGCYITEHITVLADPKQLDRLQHVIATAPRLHLLIDHQLCWIQTIKGEDQGLLVRTTTLYDAVLGWALSGREDALSVGLHHDSSVLNTHRFSFQCKASLCAARCVSSSTWEMSTGSHPFE